VVKTNQKKLEDYETVSKAVQTLYPEYTWEDVEMWMRTPKEFLFNKTPHKICADEDIDPLLQWIKEKTI
jgi:hypothetical protein